MFSEYMHHMGHGPVHHGGHHGPHPGMPPPHPNHHPPQQSYSPHPFMRPRMDATSDVFTCLFGDLFVKW